METLFTKDYLLLWMVALALALFIPVRHLIWVLYVRRASREKQPDEAERGRLKRRAAFTAALPCFVFAYFYTTHLFKDVP